MSPTVIEGLGQACRTNQEEIFGPVATLQAFSGEDEAIALANDVPYGLAASVWSRPIKRRPVRVVAHPAKISAAG